MSRIYSPEELERLAKLEEEMQPITEWIKEHKKTGPSNLLAEKNRQLLAKLQEYSNVLDKSDIKTH